eukprot:502964-Amphidinium_carterae.2
MASAAVHLADAGGTSINCKEKADVFSYDAGTATLVKQHLQALDRDGKGYVTASDLQQEQTAVQNVIGCSE